MIVRFRSLWTLLSLVAVLAGPGAAGAEAFDPPAPSDTVEIGGGVLRPERLSLSGAPRLVFQNGSATMARVELDLARGEGIACASAGEPPSKGRKFVVATGGRLECEAPSREVAYRVFRNGGGAMEELHGAIEP